MNRVFKFIIIVIALVSVSFATVLAQESEQKPVNKSELLSMLGVDNMSGETPVNSIGSDENRLYVNGDLPTSLPNFQVNDPQLPFPDGLIGRNNTTITADPSGTYIVVAWNDAQGNCEGPIGMACSPQEPPGLTGYAYSTDGGNTWIDGGAPPVFNDIFTRGNPWLTLGGSDSRTVFLASLAMDAFFGDPLGVSIHRGHFTGDIFSWDDVITLNSPNPFDLYDKEAIEARGEDIYLSVTNFTEVCGVPSAGFGQIEVWSSHDAGLTWNGPAIAASDLTSITNPDDPDCGTEGTLQQNSVPAISDDGTVYIVFQRGPFLGLEGTSPEAQIMVSRSTDGGLTFDPPVMIASINSMRENPIVGYSRPRFNDHPRIAVANSGPLKGRIYISYTSAVTPVGQGPITEQSLVSSQVFIKYSDDHGLTWSQAIPLAPDMPEIGVKRFWPVVTVEPNGKVNVVYYESLETQATLDPTDIECSISIGGGIRRSGTNSSLVNVHRVQSRDGGLTFLSPVLISSETSNWCLGFSNIRPNYGDYISAISGPNRTLMVWADSRNTYVDVFFASIRGR
jgi:hypothetical protein